MPIRSSFPGTVSAATVPHQGRAILFMEKQAEVLAELPFNKDKPSEYKKIKFRLIETPYGKWVDLRVYLKPGTIEYIPTKKGIAINKNLLFDVIQTLSKIHIDLEKSSESASDSPSPDNGSGVVKDGKQSSRNDDVPAIKSL